VFLSELKIPLLELTSSKIKNTLNDQDFLCEKPDDFAVVVGEPYTDYGE